LKPIRAFQHRGNPFEGPSLTLRQLEAIGLVLGQPPAAHLVHEENPYADQQQAWETN